MLLPALEVVPWIIIAFAVMLEFSHKNSDGRNVHGYSLIAAVLMDEAFGELRVGHPVVGFGTRAHAVENYFFTLSDTATRVRKNLQGVLAVLVLILPPVIASLIISNLAGPLSWIFEAVVLYFAIGSRSLREHAQRVRIALAEDDIEEARRAVGMIVSRDTTNMDASDISRATIESVLENGNDAIFAAIFWTLILGAPGAVLLRTSNTLDAMWGYKNDRYRDYGWFAARLDDVLNFIPARLTALTYALCGSFSSAIQCFVRQSATWYSPNAGPVMAAGAGALRVRLGGEAVYGGHKKVRPILGCTNEPEVADIDRATTLVFKSLMLWVVLALLANLWR